jgi:hypothetical protein
MSFCNSFLIMRSSLVIKSIRHISVIFYPRVYNQMTITLLSPQTKYFLWKDRAYVSTCPHVSTPKALYVFEWILLLSSVTVAVQSEAWIFAGWLLGSWVRIQFKAWMFVRVFLCCVVLCRQRPCDGLITRPSSPASYMWGGQGPSRTVEPRKKNV